VPAAAGEQEKQENRGPASIRAAALLTGSRHDGEDLLQAVLQRLMKRGRRIEGSRRATCGACSTTCAAAVIAVTGGASDVPRSHADAGPACANTDSLTLRTRMSPMVPGAKAGPRLIRSLRLIRVVIGGLRYRWLAPTVANMTMLRVRIPGGL
jgi:hypothetical protein